jgi:hypothetical protein
MNQQPPLHWRLLHSYIVEALHGQNRRTAAVAADLLVRGQYRVLSHFDMGEDGRPDPLSLAYEVELACADGWTLLCRVHWTLLGLEMADVYYELACARRQHEQGTAPYRSPSGWPAMN